MTHTYYLTRYKPFKIVEVIVKLSRTKRNITLFAVDFVAFDELTESEKQALATREDARLLFEIEDAADLDAASRSLDELIGQAEEREYHD